MLAAERVAGVILAAGAASRFGSPKIDARLGDRSLLAHVIATLLAADVPSGRPIVVPHYRGGGGPNPALLMRAAWPLADDLNGDRGMGPLIAARPDLAVEVPVDGDNPDVDTPAD